MPWDLPERRKIKKSRTKCCRDSEGDRGNLRQTHFPTSGLGQSGQYPAGLNFLDNLSCHPPQYGLADDLHRDPGQEAVRGASS